MNKILLHLIFMTGLFPAIVLAAEPVEFSKKTYNKEMGVVITQINWGRTWPCGQYENAQLQALTFSNSESIDSGNLSLELKTPSKLFVDNEFLPYVYVVKPGEYHLTAFDVKVARSTKEVLHINGTKADLIKEGVPIGGSFIVNPGEIIYIGHFGLDCGEEPFLWRYYLEGREEFVRYIEGFRKKYPIVKEQPVDFRLFSTDLFGNEYALEQPTVE